MNSRLRLEPLDERIVPAPLSAYLAAATAPPSQEIAFAVGSDVGGDAVVKSYNATGGFVGQRLAFDGDFRGGVKTAVGDVTGDGENDLVVAAGLGGGPRVRVFDGVSGATVSDFFAYAPGFTGGVNVAVGDVDGDGTAEIVTGAGRGGGSHIRAFRMDGSALWNLFAYDPAVTCGVHVAVGDLDGDGIGDIVTSAPRGGGPHVRYIRHDGVALRDFYAYAPGFAGGVNVAAGDLDGDGRAEVITAPGAGGAPHVRVFDRFGTERAGFYAHAGTTSYGTPITVTVPDAGEQALIVAGNGPGGPAALNVLRLNGTLAFSVSAFDHVEGVSFGNGSGFALSHSEAELIRLALEDAGRPAWEDDYDLDEVLAYFWEDSERIDDDVTDDILDGLGYAGILGW